MAFSLNEGRQLVTLARSAIEAIFSQQKTSTPAELATKLAKQGGVFVTLHSYPGHELRGCIGFPRAVLPLGQAIVQAAQGAASQDPRFPPLHEAELDAVIIEVSMLTQPKLIEVKDPHDCPKRIRIGLDGLIIQHGFYSGLLLPQVAPEQGWNAEQFLDHACIKAGLSEKAWLEPSTKVYKFQAQIFSETKPGGGVIEKK